MADDQSLTCSICSDLLGCPVTIPCGHNYCKKCIEDYWDSDLIGNYSCPQCRQSFTPRPTLNQNTLVAEMVERMGLVVGAPAAGPEEVECAVCTGRNLRAIKSCLVCLASYCETHLQPHYQADAFRNHKLVNPTRYPQELVCSIHRKPLEIFCHTVGCQMGVCITCAEDTHLDHKTTSPDEIKRLLREKQAACLCNIERTEMDIQEILKTTESYKKCAKEAVGDINLLELTDFLKRKESEMREMIVAQEGAAVRESERLVETLHEDIARFQLKNADIENALKTCDDIHLLQSFPTLATPPESTAFILNPNNTFADVKRTVSDLKEQLKESCELTTVRMAGQVKFIEIVEQPEPSTREEFLKYFCHLTLDPNTAHKNLFVSNDKKTSHCTSHLWKPDHLERFRDYAQVLCEQTLAGRCYWEVEWSGKLGLSIAVAYKRMDRVDSNSLFGFNRNSWRLKLTEKYLTLSHVGHNVYLYNVSISPKIGVYLDYKAGILSFYNVTDKMTLIHRTLADFTDPLCPGFKLALYTKLKICDP